MSQILPEKRAEISRKGWQAGLDSPTARRHNWGGAGPPTDRELKGKREACRIGRTISLRVMKLVQSAVTAHEKAERALTSRRAAKLTSDEIMLQLANKIPFSELLALNKDLQDRYGQARRSQHEIELDTALPMLIKIEGGLGWPAREGEDAKAPARH